MVKFMDEISFLGGSDDLEFSASSTVEVGTLTSFRSVPGGRSYLKFWVQPPDTNLIPRYGGVIEIPKFIFFGPL